MLRHITGTSYTAYRHKHQVTSPQRWRVSESSHIHVTVKETMPVFYRSQPSWLVTENVTRKYTNYY